MKKLRFLLALWLTIAATGVWAEESPETVADSIPEQVKMSDGRTVKAMQVPRRASSDDYTYTYKGVKYTYISENNYTRFFDGNVHIPAVSLRRVDDDGWYVNAEGAYITAASIDEESVPENGEVYILNDLVGYFTSHTHLGCVADQGFTGESKVKRKGQVAYSWLDQDGQQLRAGLTEYTPEMEAVFYAAGLGQYLGAISANCQLARAFAKDYSVTDTAITWGGNAGDDSTQGTDIENDGATEDNR